MSWIIDVDYAARAELRASGKYEDNAEGVTGPGELPPEVKYAMERGHTASFTVLQFRAYDAEDQPLYSGRLFLDNPSLESSAELLDALGAYGGAQRIAFPRRPELDLPRDL